MKLETILQLLYTNGHQDIVSRAVQIDNNIPMDQAVGDTIIVRIDDREDLPKDKRFKRERWGNVELTIQAVNAYDLKTPYLVILPNGKQKWVGLDDRKYSSAIDEIVDANPAPQLAE